MTCRGLTKLYNGLGFLVPVSIGSGSDRVLPMNSNFNIMLFSATAVRVLYATVSYCYHVT